METARNPLRPLNVLLMFLEEATRSVAFWVLGDALWFSVAAAGWFFSIPGWLAPGLALLIPTVAALLYFPLGVCLQIRLASRRATYPIWRAELFFALLMIGIAAALAIFWPFWKSVLPAWLMAPYQPGGPFIPFFP